MAPTARLTYFPSRGLCEPVRYLLANAGIEFEDIRIPYDEWPGEHKSKYLFGKLPVLELDGKALSHSVAICRYLAKQQGLAGNDDAESQLIDAIVETINDIRSAIVVYGFETEESQKAKKKETLLKQTLPVYFRDLEKLAEDNHGFLASGKLSLADIFFAGNIEFMSAVMEADLTQDRPALQKIVEKVHSLPGIKAWIDKRPKTQY